MHGKVNYLIKTGVFFSWYYLHPSKSSRQLIFNINAVDLIVIICLDLRKCTNVYLDFSIFTVFLKNRNIISKIRRSKVTDYAALIHSPLKFCLKTKVDIINMLLLGIAYMN